MLQIQDIRKQYITGELIQTALDGVSMTLRDNEFVAILGPSGSGKTTLLNVIGGLDRYDSGDLIINGISTKEYSDRDWDSYRNHTIGFVFQSYNLIPHQTVLANVELALTISGISRSERKKRATKALQDVGLGDQLHKRPNQMSGGQMQRVAIARALVNNPDILLADEPTGALDSETSVQVMELLKEVSKDRLVVMVTHNPELAELYANRIVRVKDGKLIDDSNPFTVDIQSDVPKHKNMGHASMSFLTALSLSFNNLRTKKGRTILTAFAGSIGIIGIALIMSLSNGFQKYIDKIQEDTLSNYPLTIQSETADTTALMSAYGSMLFDTDEIDAETVKEQQMISQMFAQVGTNDLSAFKTHMEENMDAISNDINALQYSYGVKPLIYLSDTGDGVHQANPGTIFGEITGMSMMSSYMDSDVFYEMVDNLELLDVQYEVLRGNWPTASDEMVIVLSGPNQITDYMAYTLGLKETDGLLAMIKKVMEGGEAEDPGEPMQWTYDDLMCLELCLIPQSDQYRFNSEYGVWENMTDDRSYMTARIEQGTPLKIVGIVCPRDGVTSTLLKPGVAYTSGLTKMVVEMASASEIVNNQLELPDIDVFTGKEFGAEQENQLDFKNMISVDEEKISSAFDMNVSTQEIRSLLENYLQTALKNINIDTEPAKADFTKTFRTIATNMLKDFIAENANAETGAASIRLDAVTLIVQDYLNGDKAQTELKALSAKYDVPVDTLIQVYEPLLFGMLTARIGSDPVIPDLPENPEVPELPPLPTIPENSTPDETLPEMSEPSESIPQETEAVLINDAEDILAAAQTDPPQEAEGETLPDSEVISDVVSAIYTQITAEDIDLLVNSYVDSGIVENTAQAMCGIMLKSEILEQLENQVEGFIRIAMRYFGSSICIDEEMLTSAFTFNMNEDELRRLMSAMSGQKEESSCSSNLRRLGYAEFDNPTLISLYFTDFEGKSNFLAFLDAYNEDMQNEGREDHVIRYTDITNIMMSSVRTIIDSVSYVLIAFVAVSLIVSSIMIGIITYISVMERTKEIGILRAIGASKGNISQVFNAETFIIGLCSGLIGVGLTLLLNIPINYIIHYLTNNPDIKAQLPALSGAILVILSMCLTLIGGLIPAKHAAKKDPVIALRSE